MATVEATDAARRPLSGRRVHLGDLILQLIAGAATLGSLFLVVLIVYKVVDGARPAIEKFGLGFVVHVGWNPVTEAFGAGSFLFGTAITSLFALALATPLAI